jgi:hypothetical protein
MESTKKKVGLFLPSELADALDHVASRVGKKQKWLVVGAALIRLLEASEDEQNHLIREVKIADLPGGSFDGLISQAKAKGAASSSSGSGSGASSKSAPGFQGLVAEEDHAGSHGAGTANRPSRSHAPAGTSAGTRTQRPGKQHATGRKRG